MTAKMDVRLSLTKPMPEKYILRQALDDIFLSKKLK